MSHSQPVTTITSMLVNKQIYTYALGHVAILTESYGEMEMLSRNVNIYSYEYRSHLRAWYDDEMVSACAAIMIYAFAGGNHPI
jgi:hypothetical protein